MKLKKKYYILKNYIKLLKKELRTRSLFRSRWHILQKGFLKESSVIYNLKENQPQLYLNDINRYTKASLINLGYTHILDNKLIFEAFFNDYCNVIKSSAFFYKGVFIPGRINCFVPTLKDLVTQLKAGSEFLLKPVSGGGGFNIYFLKFHNNIFYVNDSRKTEQELVDWLNSLSEYILSEKFIQKGFSHDIYPDTLNTIRVLSMYNMQKNKAFITFALHRFGTSKSKNVDNWSNGGVCAEIDIKNGRLSEAVSYPYSGKLIWHSKHPDTNIQIKDTVVPRWEEIKDVVIKLASKVPYLPYIGWDIVLSGEEIFVLEANSNTDVNLLQVHRPLLSDPDVVDFYKHHHVI